MHKFKLLATQCSISDTPTHSPTTSPVFHLRRHRHRKTLRMFLSRSPAAPHPHSPPPENKRVRRKLKDLFISSSPPFDPSAANVKTIDHRSHVNNINQIGFSAVTGSSSEGLPARRRVATSYGSLKYRLMRRAWRPVLISIPESDY